MWALFYLFGSWAASMTVIILLASGWWEENPFDSMLFSFEIGLCVMVGYLSSGARSKTIAEYWFRSISSYYARFRVPVDGALGAWTCTIVDSSDDPPITPCYEQNVGNIELEVQLGGWFRRGRCVVRENGRETNKKSQFGRWKIGFRIQAHDSNGMLVTLRGVSKKGCDGLTLKLQDAFKFLAVNAWSELGEMYLEAIRSQTQLRTQLNRANENMLGAYDDLVEIQNAILATDRLKTTVEGREILVLVLERLRDFSTRSIPGDKRLIEERLEAARNELQEARCRSRRRAAA